MRTSQVAKEAGVNIQTLRYYERRGLLPAPDRRASGYREYDEATVQRVQFIKRAQELGFTLAETADLLTLRAQAKERRPETRTIAASKIAKIDGKVRQLMAVREVLTRLVEACQCGVDAIECPIIEALEVPITTGTADAE